MATYSYLPDSIYSSLMYGSIPTYENMNSNSNIYSPWVDRFGGAASATLPSANTGYNYTQYVDPLFESYQGPSDLMSQREYDGPIQDNPFGRAAVGDALKGLGISSALSVAPGTAAGLLAGLGPGTALEIGMSGLNPASFASSLSGMMAGLAGLDSRQSTRAGASIVGGLLGSFLGPVGAAVGSLAAPWAAGLADDALGRREYESVRDAIEDAGLGRTTGQAFGALMSDSQVPNSYGFSVSNSYNPVDLAISNALNAAVTANPGTTLTNDQKNNIANAVIAGITGWDDAKAAAMNMTIAERDAKAAQVASTFAKNQETQFGQAVNSAVNNGVASLSNTPVAGGTFEGWSSALEQAMAQGLTEQEAISSVNAQEGQSWSEASRDSFGDSSNNSSSMGSEGSGDYGGTHGGFGGYSGSESLGDGYGSDGGIGPGAGGVEGW